MEFGVALFGVVASVALSKLLTVKGRLNTDATFIRLDLNSIEAALKDHAGKGLVSYLHTEHISQLKALAYDIEDCIDRFNAKTISPADFANQIADLRTRAKDTTDRIKRFSFGPERADGPLGVDIPIELQNLGAYNLDCLLYLSLFPPNHLVRTKPLMRRWLAEGLVQGETTAADNLKILTDSSIINIDSILTSNNGNVKSCQPTQEMLQYISRRSTTENFILLCAGAAKLQAESARRLSVYPSANGHLILPRDKFLPNLRTLAVFTAGAMAPDRYEAALDFNRYGVLRVLDLKECAHMNGVYLQSIWNQVLIKYLSIQLGSTDSITRRIGKLKQLETLDLTGNEIVVTVFKEVLLLPKLKHLLGKFQLHKADTLWRWRWSRVQSEVEKFQTEVGVLETMAGFVIGERPGFPQLMSLMRMLRKVKVWCQSDASQKNLDDLSSAITKFILDGNRQPDLDRSLSIDFQGCSRQFVNTISDDGGILTSLKLHGHLTDFPLFVSQLSSIVELCLSFTSLSWEKIRDGLKMVRGLKYLKLIEDELESLDILSEKDHLKAIERIYVVCRKELKIAITVTQLVSVHILCEDLRVIPNMPFIDSRRMARLKKVVLHNRVADALKVDLPGPVVNGITSNFTVPVTFF